MTQTRRTLAPLLTRLPTELSTLAILFGDLVILFIFLAAGQYSHDYFFWEVPVHTLLAYIPFAIAWALVAPAVGLYSREILLSYTETVTYVIPAWIGVSLIGGAIRATDLFPGSAPLEFLLANIVFGLLFFVPWRLFASYILQRAEY